MALSRRARCFTVNQSPVTVFRDGTYLNGRVAAVGLIARRGPRGDDRSSISAGDLVGRQGDRGLPLWPTGSLHTFVRHGLLSLTGSFFCLDRPIGP